MIERNGGIFQCHDWLPEGEGEVHCSSQLVNNHGYRPVIYEITPASGLTNQGWYTSTRWVPWLDCKALQRICSGHWHRDPFSGHCSVRWCWQPPCGSRLWLLRQPINRGNSHTVAVRSSSLLRVPSCFRMSTSSLRLCFTTVRPSWNTPPLTVRRPTRVFWRTSLQRVLWAPGFQLLQMQQWRYGAPAIKPTSSWPARRARRGSRWLTHLTAQLPFSGPTRPMMWQKKPCEIAQGLPLQLCTAKLICWYPLVI